MKETIEDEFRMVGDFHHKFGLPNRTHGKERPHLLSSGASKFRSDFMQEELDEFIGAVNAGDLATAADSLVDLVYVALGTAQLMGLPWHRIFSAVHDANMQKVRCQRAEDSTRASTYDVIKPPNWRHPNIQAILEEDAAS